MASEAELRPVERRNLSQAVAQQLLEAIRSGAYPAGTRLPPEVELKERFEVGRSTIREALNGLVLVGAIEVRHGLGAVVLQQPPRTPLGLETALRRGVNAELLEAREALELATASLAAQRADGDNLARLVELLQRAEAKTRSGKSPIEEGPRFHLLIADAARNEILYELMTTLMGHLYERGLELTKLPRYPEWELEAHRGLLTAIQSGDPGHAQATMVEHLGDMRVILLEGWDVFEQSRR